MKKTTLLLLIQLCYAQITFSQNDSLTQITMFESAVEDLLKKPTKSNTKVSSAAKIEQNIVEASSITNLIDKETLNQYGFFSLNQVLWQQAGFSISRDYERFTPSFRGNYEGWNNNRILVLVDGMPFNEGISNSAWTFEAVSPLMLGKSIEVVRGGVSSLYGNNAMNGTINIHTLDAQDLRGSVEARVRVGNHAAQIYDFTSAIKGEKISAVVAYNHFHHAGFETDSYDMSGKTNPDGTLQKMRLPEKQNGSYFFAKIKLKQKLLNGLMIQYHEQNNSPANTHGFLFAIPDQPEEFDFIKRVLAVSYQKTFGKWKMESVGKYQLSKLNWKIRMLPNNSYLGDVLYATGLTEHLKTKMRDVFTRFQLQYESQKVGTALIGIENNVYIYGKDDIHMANAYLNSDFLPTANNEFIPLPQVFQYMDGQLVTNVGLFAQYISPKVFSKKSSLHLSVRYDKQSFKYNDITQPNVPISFKQFSQLNPRMTLVWQPFKSLTMRAILGRSFRMPALSETVSANSFAYASNVKQLQPETVDNIEWVTDWISKGRFHIRNNLFYMHYQNLIFYSFNNGNLSTNIYSAENLGFETEFFYKTSNISAFFNIGYVKRLGETIIDPSISQEKTITWVPASTAKAGIVFEKKNWTLNFYTQYQGKVRRRTTDLLPTTLFSQTVVETSNYRPQVLKGWTNLHTRVAYRWSEHIDIALTINNLLNSKMMLMKNNAFTFDHEMPKQQWLLELKLNY